MHVRYALTLISLTLIALGLPAPQPSIVLDVVTSPSSIPRQCILPRVETCDASPAARQPESAANDALTGNLAQIEALPMVEPPIESTVEVPIEQPASVVTRANRDSVASNDFRPRKDPDKKDPGKDAGKDSAAGDRKVSADRWMESYDDAMTVAERKNKMLFIYFCDACGNGPCNRFKVETLDNAHVKKLLQDYVCVQLPLDASIIVKGKPVKLLEHASFREMLGQPGIAIVDFRSSDAKLRGTVTSVFPITQSLWYTPQQMAVILNLPAGTLTQRTLIYAVRTHPERPASTDSKFSADLAAEAQSQAQYQATVRVQGHQFWESRFQRIIARLPHGLLAREVCAESWPGQNLVEAAIECVRCWRLSSGHWGAVRSPNRCFGYDMKRGANGVWYATGIFGAR